MRNIPATLNIETNRFVFLTEIPSSDQGSLYTETSETHYLPELSQAVTISSGTG